MRSSSSYRAARKKDAKSVGIPLAKYNAAFNVAARAAEAVPPSEAQDAARKKLALWAASGGRETAISQRIPDEVLKRMNDAAIAHALQPPEPMIEDAVDIAKKLTVADIDKTMEAALSKWQAARQQGPMPLSKLFAARARQLGWVEDVEFEEEK